MYDMTKKVEIAVPGEEIIEVSGELTRVNAGLQVEGSENDWIV